jgi:hypothetical protein
MEPTGDTRIDRSLNTMDTAAISEYHRRLASDRYVIVRSLVGEAQAAVLWELTTRLAASQRV